MRLSLYERAGEVPAFCLPQILFPNLERQAGLLLKAEDFWCRAFLSVELQKKTRS